MKRSKFYPLHNPPEPVVKFQTGKQKGQAKLGRSWGVNGTLAQEQKSW